MITRRVQKIFDLALAEVKKRRHEFLTLEHILYGLLAEKVGKNLILKCGGSPAALKHNLEQFFNMYLEQLDKNPPEIMQTIAVERTMQTAMAHLHSAGKERLDVGDLLAAILEEDDSWAAFYLKKMGITRLQVLECISDNQLGEDSIIEEDDDDSKEEVLNNPLARYTVELTAKAKSGDIDPLVGREGEVARSLEILARRRKNNPLYVGEPGTGKTAIAEGLALKIAQGNVPEEFKNARIFALDLGSVLAGARYRGDFEGRIKAVVASLIQIPESILFIDEIHTIVGAGSTSSGTMDASNLLKPVLAEGKLRCIGSTTHEEFRNHFEKDRALARRFQKVDIREPSSDECFDILRGLESHYEEYHHVHYTQEALRSAVDLSVRHIQDRLLPDKAIDVIDEAGACVRLREDFLPGIEVTKSDIEQIVARMAGIPPRTVSGKEQDRLKALKKDLHGVIFGQDEAIDVVNRAILRSRAWLSGGEKRPAGSFLFYGPSGVGKTELAKQIAECLSLNFIRFDMSEYMEKHAVSRLIGAPPGYVGFDQGGLLTEAVRKTPYSLVLLDEVEKAHPDIMNVLLQVMDYATLTDNTGRKADFRNVVLIMTTNAGVREIVSSPMGFIDGKHDISSAAKRGRKALENAFSPEFRNRLDAIVPFNELTPDLMEQIVDKSLVGLQKELKEKHISLELMPSGRSWLAKKGYDPKLGARPLQRLLREALEYPLASEVLFGKLVDGGKVIVDAPQGDSTQLSFSFE